VNAEQYIDRLATRTPDLKKEGQVTIAIAEFRRHLMRAFEAGRRDAIAAKILDRILGL
jgi:hypothetical protein